MVPPIISNLSFQDVATTTLTDIETAHTSRDAMTDETWAGLDHAQQEEAQKHKCVVVNGKKNRYESKVD